MDGSTKEQAGHRDQEHCLALARKWDSASDTEIMWVKSALGVWGLANFFSKGKFYYTHHVPEASPLPSPLPSLLPTQPNLMPSAAKYAAQVESPILWPLFSMCTSSESNTPARKSGTQSLSLRKANMYPNRQFLAHVVVHMPLCLHVLFCVAGLLHTNQAGGGGVNRHLGYVLSGVRGYRGAQAITMQVGGGGDTMDDVHTFEGVHCIPIKVIRDKDTSIYHHLPLLFLHCYPMSPQFPLPPPPPPHPHFPPCPPIFPGFPEQYREPQGQIANGLSRGGDVACNYGDGCKP